MDYVKLPKLDAARVLGVAPRTVDRMIERGDLETEREPHGRRRVLALVPADDVQEQTALGESESAEGARLRERVRSLEDLSEFRREQLQLSESRNQDLMQMLRSAQDLNERLQLALPAPRPARPWWKVWQGSP